VASVASAGKREKGRLVFRDDLSSSKIMPPRHSCSIDSGILATDIKVRALGQQGYNSTASQLLRQVFGGRVGGDVVMLHAPLAKEENADMLLNQIAARRLSSEVGEGIFLLLPSWDILAFFDKAHHPFAGLRASGLAEKRKALVEPFDLAFDFNEVLLKALAQTVEPCRSAILGSALMSCFSAWRMSLSSSTRSSLMPSGAVGGELSVLIAVSWLASEVEGAGEAMNSQSPPSFHRPLVSISPSSPVPVESLKNWFISPDVGASLPIEKAGFFMLSRAAEDAFMCVISRVTKNCRASF
jgi:hypothetical protein